MNLIGDPWIPVVFEDGETRPVGLDELYEQAEDIRDLALAPPQRIAVMRLLICITQAALDGPEDADDWRACESRIQPESLAYLEARWERFDLFGETPFVQIGNLRADKWAPLDKLDFGLASGNNKTLFDQSATAEGRDHPAAWVALQLLTFLNFSTGGKVGQANWQNRRFSAATKAAPCLQAAHAFARGKMLRETLQLNMLTKAIVETLPGRAWGTPVWDLFPKSPDDKEAIENTTRTYLGRLVPLTRLIKVLPRPERQHFAQAICIIGPPADALAFEGPPNYREPSTTLVENNGEYAYLTVSVDKHIWRELGSVLVLNENLREAGAPPAFHNLRELRTETHFDIWIGALIPSRADIEDAVEWNLSVPNSVFSGNYQLNRYQANVDLAENAAVSLSSAVRAYLDEINAHKGSDQRSRNTRNGVVKRASAIYWQELDQRYGMLFSDGPVDRPWQGAVHDALLHAYEQSCAHETPRQIQAFAAGRRRLSLHRLVERGG